MIVIKMKKEFGKTPKEPETRINASIFGGGGLMATPSKNSFTIEKTALKHKKLSGMTMFTILFILFMILKKQKN